MKNQQDYHYYLAGREWALLKRAVRERSGGRCERCRLNPYQQTHHLTYERLYHESLEDLQGVCRGCHEYLSGISNVDPALEVQNLRQQIFEAHENDPVLAIRLLAQNLIQTADQLDRFNQLIQIFIVEQERNNPDTAWKLADLKFQANKRFHEFVWRVA